MGRWQMQTVPISDTERTEVPRPGGMGYRRNYIGKSGTIAIKFDFQSAFRRQSVSKCSALGFRETGQKKHGRVELK